MSTIQETTLSGLYRAIRRIDDSETGQMEAAREILPSMDVVLTDWVDDETRARLWVQLARAATGTTVTILSDPTDWTTARDACLDVVQPATVTSDDTPTGEVRAEILTQLARVWEIDTTCRPLVAEARQLIDAAIDAGLTVTEIAVASGRDIGGISRRRTARRRPVRFSPDK